MKQKRRYRPLCKWEALEPQHFTHILVRHFVLGIDAFDEGRRETQSCPRLNAVAHDFHFGVSSRHKAAASCAGQALSTHTLSSVSLCKKASPLPAALSADACAIVECVFLGGSTDAHFALFCGRRLCRSSVLNRFVQCIFLVINQVILCIVYKVAQFFACLVVAFIWILL